MPRRKIERRPGDPIGFVYRWTNTLNGKKYIGAHIGRPDDGYTGSGQAFRRAVRHHGIEAFEREILHLEALGHRPSFRSPAKSDPRADDQLENEQQLQGRHERDVTWFRISLLT